MSLTDLIKRRKNVVHLKSEGLNLAISLIDDFQDRTFTFKGLKRKYSRLNKEDLLKRLREELESMLIFYRYTTRVQKYTDKKGALKVEMKLVGKASMMNRYNLLDIEMDIKTETSRK